MSSIASHIDAWYKYIKSDVKAIEEEPEILAGREAENLLRNIVNENYQFKGCRSFSSKRIYNPAAGHKNEIDLIVVTEKKLYALECKNWGGKLIKEGDKWVQMRSKKDGRGMPIRLEHDDPAFKNEEKKKLLINHLRSAGINIGDRECEQKVILMNKNLTIESNDISSNKRVITPGRLIEYLGRQNNRLKAHERFFSSIISLLLDDEVSDKIVDGLFKRIGGKDYNKMINIITRLPTWDKVSLHGTKIVSGDILKSQKSIFKNPRGVPFDRIKRIIVSFPRSKPVYFVKSLLSIGLPITLKLYDANGCFIQKAEGNPDGLVRVLPAGNSEFIDYTIFQVEEIIYGKYV